VVLFGGRATPTTNSCTGNRDKAPRRKCSQFLDLIGSVAVAVPADYTRYMNQACIYMRKVGEAVKDGWQPIAAEAQTLRMVQVDFRFLLPEEVDGLVDEAGSLYARIIAHDPADHSCDYFLAAKPQRRESAATRSAGACLTA
jgi:hypothetical protein